MSVSTMPPLGNVIDFDYRATGEVLCKNPKGLVFFLRVAAPLPLQAQPQAPTAWQPVASTHEVEVKRHAEPQSMTDLQRSVRQAAVAEPLPTAPAFTQVEASREVAVRRAPEHAPQAAAVRGTAPLPDVPLPGKAPQKGWFGKLFNK